MPEPDSKPKDSITRYIEFIIRWRWAVLFATLAVAVGIGSGARHLGLATDYRVFFGAENPDLLAFEAIENIYTKNDNVLFVVQPKNSPDGVFNAATIDIIRELTDDAWQIPYSTRVDSITNFQHSWAEQDDLVVEDLLPEGPVTAEAVRRVAEVAMKEPLLVGRMLSTDGKTTGVNVRIMLPGQSTEELPKLVAHVRAMRAELSSRHPDHRFALTGISMLNNAFAETPLTDMPKVMPVMFGVFVMGLLLFLRSARAAGATLMLVMLSAAIAVGATGYAGFLFDPTSASAPIIILTLAVADSIHILVSFFGRLRAGDERSAALIEAYRVNAQPVFLTSITTAVGFLSLNASDSPPFHLLGNVTAFGVLVAWAYSMTFLPAMLSVLAIRTPRSAGRTSRISATLADFVTQRPRTMLATVAALALVLIASVGTLRVNDKFIEYFDESLRFRQDTDFTVENLTGIYLSTFSIDSGETQGVSDPRYLSIVDDFATWMRTRPGVVHVSTFTDTMKRLNMNMHGDDPAAYRLPEARDMGAQFLLLYEMSLPYGLDVNDQINLDKSALRIDVTYGDIGTQQMLESAAEGQAWLVEHGYGAMAETRAAGVDLMFGHITERNLRSMAVGTGLGFAIISIILMIALRSVRLGLLSLIPNVLPAAMAFGVWAFIYDEVGFAISVVAGLSIGIIVDDTVHFLAKYQRARRDLGYDATQAVRHAFEVVGPAIIGTSVIVAAGFAMLSLSVFRVTAYMGLLTSLAVIAALITDLFLLPALLIVVDRKPVRATALSSEPLTSNI